MRIPLADLGPILHASGDWNAGAITAATVSGTSLHVSGAGGSGVISASTLRSSFNDQAPCVYPDRYPTLTATGKKLPQPVPSIDFTMVRSGSDVVLTGRGWGHAVGMSQYGAKSLAERGHSYADILSYYYGGLRPETITEPGAIRVLVAEDASFVRVLVEGAAKATTATGSTLAPGSRFEVAGGTSLQIGRGIGPTLAPVLAVELASVAPAVVPRIV